MTQPPVTPDPITPPAPAGAEEPPQDPAAALDAAEERVFGDGSPLDAPAPELVDELPAGEPSD